MRYGASELEEIIRSVNSGQCEDVLKKLDIRKIRKFPPFYVSKLIFGLIPQSTRSSKELTELLLQYGRIKWNERNEEGRFLHTVMIRFNRVDMAVKAVSGIRRADAHDPDLTPIWAGLLWWLLDKYQKTAAMTMIRKGVMREMDDEELERVSKKIFSYHDITLFDAAHKYMNRLSPKIFHMPESLSEQQFMREVLDRYQNMVQLEEHEDTEKLWKISLQCSAANMIAYLLKKTEDYQYLALIASGSEEVFNVLLNVRSRKIIDDVKKEVLFRAISGDQWRQRFDILVQRGWKKSSQNRKQDIYIAAEYLGRIERKRYITDKKGHLEQINDRAKARFLISYEKNKKNNKNNK